MTRGARWAAAAAVGGQFLYAGFFLLKAGVSRMYASFPESPAYDLAQPLFWPVLGATLLLMGGLLATWRRVPVVTVIWAILLASFVLLFKFRTHTIFQLVAIAATVAWIVREWAKPPLGDAP